jgi:hypothetical protein
MPYKHTLVEQVGSVGFIAPEDTAPPSVPPNGWQRAHNVRFDVDGARAALGWETAVNLGEILPVITEEVWLDVVMDFDRAWWLGYSRNEIGSIDDTETVRLVTRQDPPGTVVSYNTPSEGFWSFTNFKGIPVATNGVDIPQVQFESDQVSPRPDTLFQDWAGWVTTYPGGGGAPTTTMRAQLVEAYQDYLVFANFTDWNGQARPTRVWWSEPAGTGTLPPSMDFFDPESRAGFYDLPVDDGPIQAMRVLRDAVMIYTLQSVWRMQWIGGQYVMKFDKVASHFGALGPFCVEEVRGNHLVVTTDDVVMFDGQREQSICNGRVRRWLFSRINTDERNRVVVGGYPREGEVWIGLPVGGSSARSDQALVYRYKNDTWATRDLPQVYHMRTLPRLQPAEINPRRLVWDEVPGSLDAWNNPFWLTEAWTGSLQPDAIYDYGLYAGSIDGQGKVIIRRMDTGLEHEGIESYETVLERTDLNLTGDEQTSFLRAIYPQAVIGAESLGDEFTWDAISLSQTPTWDDEAWVTTTWNDFTPEARRFQIAVGGQRTAGALPQYKQLRDFQIGKDYRTTHRARGRRHGLRIDSVNVGTWRLSGYTVQWTQSGRR